VGTPFYISPEQARGTKNLDGRTDIYSLGCTIFHMLTGSIPFIAEALTDIMVMHTEAPRPDPRSLLPEISAGSARLIMRMMALKPEDRPQSAVELGLEIEALLPLLPEPEELVRPAQRVLSSEPEAAPPKERGSWLATAEAPQEASQPRRPSRLRRLVKWILGRSG
jgi:serine/threonine-protein kinase